MRSQDDLQQLSAIAAFEFALAAPAQGAVAGLALRETASNFSALEADRLAVMLLDMARTRNPPPALQVASPFFRLAPEERFLIAALSGPRWSYARSAKVLGWTREQVEEVAWRARVSLGLASGAQMPSGSLTKATCPEYIPERPWTQAFLDEELDKRRTLFLQNHLMGCEGCRKALDRARHVVVQGEALLGEVRGERALELASVYREGRAMNNPSMRSHGENVSAFLRSAAGQRAALGTLGFLFLAFLSFFSRLASH